MGNQPNSLYLALVGDTISVPAGRVYELQAGGFYPLANNPTSPSGHTTVIVGSDPTMVVTNKNASSSPPLICGYAGPSGSNPGGINANGDLTIKNCTLVPAANDGSEGWAYTGANVPHLHLLFENCIWERTRWIFVVTGNPGGTNSDVTFRDCYFVNMNGHPWRRDGGVLDNFAPQDSLVVENCTHICAQGGMYRFRDSPYKRIIINHNTFIDCAGWIFQSFGYQSNMSLTNNIFVNCNVQSYPGPSVFKDTTEQDRDFLPIGLVNVYPDSADVANNTPRRFLCQDNIAYWDPSLANMDSILNANRVDGWTNWQSQRIIMNSRTDSMFKHIGRFNATPYSYLRTDAWKNQMPHFTDPKDLFTTQLANVKTFALGTVDTGIAAGHFVLPDWRLVNDPVTKFVYPDWPIQVDLSYSDADLRSGGLGGYPLGDLNWFPAQKAAWLGTRTAEYASIQNALDGATLVSAGHDRANVPGIFRLDQNYPNPFNPTTTITYELPQAAHVRLTVCDILGREVQTLVNEMKQPGRYETTFNASKLASGVYFYRLRAGDYMSTKKLILLR